MAPVNANVFEAGGYRFLYSRFLFSIFAQRAAISFQIFPISERASESRALYSSKICFLLARSRAISP
ncbi:hypothetical protein D6833_02810 [Candidatus Parcubacteria bacterium]|nr:MAG: hypothetical protein D6833_02810 [Candidatus Parcubacteria bacterium]